MADKLILQDEDKKKKKPGLVMQDDPVRLPAPKPITETPSIGQTVPNTGLQLQDDPSRTISFKSKPVEEQRSNIVDMTEGSLQKFYEKGEYPSIPQDQLDKYLDAKYGDVWSEDFLSKAKRGVGSAFEMIGEDLFVNLFYEGPKQSARMGLTNIADQFMERDAASATLKREFLSFTEPATRLSIRQQRTGGSSKLVDDLKQIQIKERRAIHNANKFFFLDPRAGYKESDGERRPTFLKNTKAREDKFKKVIESIKAESVRRAKLILPTEKAEGLKVKSVSEMFDRSVEPGFGIWKAFDPNLPSILKDTAKVAHPFSSVPTAAEAVTRGAADIGMIGHFIANNMFDMTAHHQRTVNKHLNMRLKEYWGKRGSEYKPAGAGFYPDAPKPNMKGISGEQAEQWLGEVGKAHDELKKIRRDEWAMMQILITDREKARLGLDPMISQYLKNWDKELPGNQEAWAKWFKKTINSKYAEAGSYGLDPVTIATGGIGAFSKAPLVASGRGIVRTLGSGGVKLTGELLEESGKKLGTAVSKVDSVAGEGAAGAAAGAVVGLTTDLPLVPSIVGGATASGVVQPIQKGSALAKWVEASGLTLRAAGEILAREPGMEGFMRRLSVSSTAPERVATVASKLEWLDNAITFGADITKAGGTGVVIGGGLGAATGEGTEFTFAGAVTGGTLGVATVIPVRIVTPASKVKQLADVDAWVQRQPEGVRKFLKARPIEDQITASELDLFVKGFGAYEGKGDVVVEYIHSKEGIEGAWVDTEGKIIINLGYEGPRTLSHEIGHAARSLAMAEPEGSPMREKYEQLRSKLFERTAGGTTLKGWYSIEDEIEFAKQYHERLKKSLSEEKLRKWEVENGFDFKTSELTKEGYLANDKGRMTIQGEIEAESFANFIQGNKPGATFKARTAKQRMLNHIMLSEHSRTLGAMRWMLEDVFKVKFNGDGSVSKMFQKNGKGITNSKVVNAAIGQFIAARKAVREQIVPDSGSMSPGQKFNMEEVRSEPSLVEYFGAHDAFAKDRNGNILFVDDKPVMLPKREIGKLQRNRMKQMVAALESVDEIGGLKMEKTSKGKKRWSGKNFSEDQVNALLALPDDVFSPRLKDNLKFIYDKINEGASIHYDYNSALSLGKYSSEISAAWRHDMPYAVEITQAGNFLVKGINVDRINSKISKWKSDKKGRFLDLWEGNHSEFYADLMQYMSNHRKGDKGKTGLHPDGAMAKRRADRINELFGVYGSELKRSETVGRSSKRGATSSRRFDRINQLRTGGGEWSADYGYLKDAYMPAAPEKGGAKYMPGRKEARSTTSDIRAIAKLASLNESELFRSGLGSKAKDIESIAKHHSIPGQEIEVKPWTVDNDPYGSRRNRGDIKLQMTREGGHVSEVDITLHKDGNLHIDSSMADSNLMKGGGGDQLYQIPLDFAFHNDKIRIPDPNGLSEVASKRLIPQLLSSGLKHKSFKHIGDPALRSDTGANPTKLVAPWDPKALPEGMSDFDYKAGVLALTELKNVRKVFPEISSFQVDPKSGLLTGNVDGKTQTYHRGDKPIGGSDSLEGLVKQIRSRPGGDFIGETTLIRSAGYMAQEGRGYSSLLLGHGEQAKPGVSKLPGLSGLEETFYMPAGKPPKQKHTSKGTSLEQVPALMKSKLFTPKDRNIDIGAGKSMLGTEYLEGKGVENVRFDPFNVDASINRAAVDRLKGGERFPTATIPNVLNTIKEKGVRSNVIHQAARSIDKDGTAFFSIYEGDKSGKGSPTSAGYQNNKRAGQYLSEVKQWFGDVERRGNVIVARKPIRGGKADWLLGEEGPSVKFMPAGEGIKVAPGEVRAKVDSEFKLSKPVLAQYMPAGKKVDIMDYADRPMFTLASDNLAGGEVKVGPRGAKQAIDIKAQGGREFMNIYNGGGWAFTNSGTAKAFLKRVRDVASGKDSAIVGVTSLGPTNHFNSPYGQLGFVRSLEAAVDSGHFSQRRMDKYIKDFVGVMLKSTTLKGEQRALFEGVKGFAGFRRLIESKKVNFKTAGLMKDKFRLQGTTKNARLEITQAELLDAGIDLKSLMRDLSDAELRDIEMGDVSALMEVSAMQSPKKTDFHYSYPWTVEGKAIGFLEKFPNVRDLTSDRRIFNQQGRMTQQPLQTVMPEFNRLKSGEVKFMPAGKSGGDFKVHKTVTGSDGWLFRDGTFLNLGDNYSHEGGIIQWAKEQAGTAGIRTKNANARKILLAAKEGGARSRGFDFAARVVRDKNPRGSGSDKLWVESDDLTSAQRRAVKDWGIENRVEVTQSVGSRQVTLHEPEGRGSSRYMPAGKGGDIFYSNSSKALDSPKVRKSATGPAMLNDILKVDPAAGQEMKWIDLDRWLMDKKGKVTKEEVQDFINTNQITVVEKVRGGEASPKIKKAEMRVEDAEQKMWAAEDRGTHEDYRLAEDEYTQAVRDLEHFSKGEDTTFDKPDLVLPGAKKGSYRELELMLPKRKGEQFTESHFEGDENVFAHVRFNERTDADGKRMLFIEEVQSDWAAKGRDLGFDEPYINGDIVGGPTESVPAAPFVSRKKGGKFVEDDKWRALAVKRMIRWASDEGFDRVGWINGRDTADRYNLSKFVDRIEYQRLAGDDMTMITAWDKAGNKIINDRRFGNRELKGAVTKGIAEKIIADKSGQGEFTGMDLVVGGEGHKQFYDVDLPNYTSKYVKKWGGKVGEVGIDAGDFKVMKKNFNGGPYFSLESRSSPDSISNHPTAEAAWAEAERLGGTTAHYIDITPKMKGDVQQGQAMFMPARGKSGKVKRKGSATSRKPGARIPMGAVAKQLRLERDLKELKRN